MMSQVSPHKQQGVITIFIAMIMLILITLLVVTAFSLSTTNLRAVGNVQARDGAVAAAQFVIEQVVGEDFGQPAANKARIDFPVDINEDGVTDYLVNVPTPLCVRHTQATIESSSSVTLPGFSAASAWNTVWEIQAVATDVTTGARVSVVQGVRALLTDVQKEAECPSP